MKMALTGKSLIVLLGIAAAFAAEKERPKFTPAAASSYPTRQTISKVTIAAVPYRMRPTWTEPRSASSTPTVRRPARAGSDPERLRPDHRARQTQGGVGAARPRPHGGHARRGPEVHLAARSVPTSIPARCPDPGHVSEKKSPLAAWEIEGRAFVARMLAPRDSASGFFYFRAGSRRAAPRSTSPACAKRPRATSCFTSRCLWTSREG